MSNITQFLEGQWLEIMLKDSKDLNSIVSHKANYHCVNGMFILEVDTQGIADAVVAEQPEKVLGWTNSLKETTN